MKEFKINNLKGIPLNIIEGKQIDSPRAIVIHVHGIASHFQEVYECEDSFSYRDNLFTSNNIKSFALEFHGHGKSSGLKCSIDDFDNLVDDLFCLVNYIKSNQIKYSLAPIFIIAESMGGAVAIKYNIKYQFKTQIKGYILLCPMCGIDDRLKPNPILVNILMFLSNFIPTFKALNTNSKIKTDCHNEEYQKLKEECEYFYHDKMRLNTARECYHTSLWINKYGHLFNAPVFLLHGIDDTVTNPELSIKFYDKVPNKIKNIYLPKNTNHSLMIRVNEEDEHPKIVWEKIHYWIEQLI